MKALTLWQPHATLVAIGAKKIETRSWPTKYRGPLAIHAAKKFPREYVRLCWREPFRSALGLSMLGLMMVQDILPRGYVLATGELVNCVPIQKGKYSWPRVDRQGVDLPSFFPDRVWIPPKEPELSFGNYEPGRFAWVLENVKALPEPIPARGKQRLWEWNE